MTMVFSCYFYFFSSLLLLMVARINSILMFSQKNKNDFSLSKRKSTGGDDKCLNPKNTFQDLSRREFGASLFGAGVITQIPMISNAILNEVPFSQFISKSVSLKQAVGIILSHCSDDYLEAVIKTRKFIYRGEGCLQPIIVEHREDLFDEETYGSRNAVEYFKALEQYLKSKDVKARPSNSHIAIADKEVAGKWGAVCSIWPLGNLHFTWLQNQVEFYDENMESNIPTLLTNEAVVSELFQKAGAASDKDLKKALDSGHEILLSSNVQGRQNLFLAIPDTLDQVLLKALMEEK